MRAHRMNSAELHRKSRGILSSLGMRRLGSILIALSILIAAGCKSNGEDPDLSAPLGDEDFTVLIYMAGDNSMAKDIDYTLKCIREGAQGCKGNVVVYVDRPSRPARLIRVSAKGDDQLLATYTDSDSGRASTLATVLEETRARYPNQEYGLVIWSHADGWLPRTTIRSIAPDNSTGNAIDIDLLAQALPDSGLEYIWFDACFMGSIEVFYQLRNKAHYLIGSPTEVLMASAYDASGIPYHKVLPYLLSHEESSLITACQKYIRHYYEKPSGSTLQSASIAMVQTSKLDDLYRATRTALAGKLSSLDDLRTDHLQTYHRPQYPDPIYYDLGDIVTRIGGESREWDSAYKSCVIYKGATPRFTQSTKKGSESFVEINPNKFSGLSCYLPLTSESQSRRYAFYFDHIDWSSVWNLSFGCRFGAEEIRR